MDFRNRILGLEYIHSRDLDSHPGNWRDHPKPQVEALRGVLAEVGEAVGQIGEAAILARELVAAAEQLWLTGRLPRDERLDYVMDKLALYFPDLDRQQVYPLVEAAVYWLKRATQQEPTDLPVPLGGARAGTQGARHA